MAYNLANRFPPSPKYFTLLDPGSYSYEKSKSKQNAAPFLSKTPRKTQGGAKLWTQAVYNQSLPRNVPNCSSMLSKNPRFPYEAFNTEDLEEILCKCGIITCECPTGEEIEENVICQGKLRRRLFKGHALSQTPHSDQQRKKSEIKKASPPFYDTKVHESTAFYQGCKWSKRTARVRKNIEVTPGPTDYFIVREPTEFEICAEKVRAFKRKTSRQLRFIEIVQQKNILENRPSPAAYSPKLPKGTDLKFIGSKAKRFPTAQYDIRPGPADHWLRRDFDSIKPPDMPCRARLPQAACFGMKAQRFKTQREEGPSPATYQISFRNSNFVNCHNAPFGTSAKRFKKEIIEESDDDEIDGLLIITENEAKLYCIKPTWVFKSKTTRMKPLLKKYDEPSPADIIQAGISKKKQSIVPFSSSECRFMPWYSWIPVHGFLETPGTGHYSPVKPKCFPAFKHGPLYRSQRFPNVCHRAPSPNAYQVHNGIETILATHNKRLKSNIKDQFKSKYQDRPEPKVISLEERELCLLDKCIAICESDEDEDVGQSKILAKNVSITHKPKMLRHYLYSHPTPYVN